ncbi:MAG: hypothetical protein WAM60_19580 [Candidatus Promineifilaceae bacterium]
MKKQLAQYNRKILAGCGLFVLLAITAVFGLAALFISIDRQAARYPDADPISNHENYSGLPFNYKWDNAYHTNDPFPAVYNWYSTGFNLGPEMRANGRCILMEGSEKHLAATRQTSVLLCDTPNGRMIYVSRSTFFR